ncbi:unnamed protein product [Lupinus luteus]|uniref:Uncharacterized protein n=1 Tax=Lupinus luteus TaxID=3873 RepID=A0AAV1XGG1_LUPLU
MPKVVPGPKKKLVEKVVNKNNDKDFVINLEIDHNEEVDLQNVTRIDDIPSSPLVSAYRHILQRQTIYLQPDFDSSILLLPNSDSKLTINDKSSFTPFHWHHS